MQSWFSEVNPSECVLFWSVGWCQLCVGEGDPNLWKSNLAFVLEFLGQTGFPSTHPSSKTL